MSGDHNQYQKDRSYLDQKPRMKGLRWHAKPDGDDLLVCFDYAVKPEDEYVRFVRAGQQSDFECPRCGHCCHVDDDDTSQECVDGIAKAEHDKSYERGFVDGMQHQMRSTVDKAINKEPTKIFGPNLEEILNSAGFYKKREWVGLTDEEFKFIASKYSLPTQTGMEYFKDELEAKLKEKNT
jgi:hypothetical protein